MGLLVTPGATPKLKIRCGKLQYCDPTGIHYYGCFVTSNVWTLDVSGVGDFGCGGTECADQLDGSYDFDPCANTGEWFVDTTCGGVTYTWRFVASATLVQVQCRTAGGTLIHQDTWDVDTALSGDDCDDKSGTVLTFTKRVNTLASFCSFEASTVTVTV